MKKIIASAVVLALLGALVYVFSGWMRFEKKRSAAEIASQKLVDFYVTMDADNVEPLIAISGMKSAEAEAIHEYRATIAAARSSGSSTDRIEKLRSAQKISFGLFGSASGSLALDSRYRTWKEASSDSGIAFPVILQYNQVTKDFDDEIAVFPGSVFATFFGVSSLPLIDVNGQPFQQRPSRI